MRRLFCLAATGFIILNLTSSPAMAGYSSNHKKTANTSIERGRYMVKMAGCNDCHTAGYIQSAGQVPEDEWLLGSNLGWKGAWGTTYPSNLRIVLSKMSEADWLNTARTAKYRPPMPWFALHDMKEQDLRAIYRFVKHLGPAGEAAPAYIPPDQATQPPYVLFP